MNYFDVLQLHSVHFTLPLPDGVDDYLFDVLEHAVGVVLPTAIPDNCRVAITFRGALVAALHRFEVLLLSRPRFDGRDEIVVVSKIA